jgi:hypothetical protein
MGRGWWGIVKRDPCPYCGRFTEGRQTLEHIVPLADGGTAHWTNLSGACCRCNQAKGRTPLLLFLLEQERYRRMMAPILRTNAWTKPEPIVARAMEILDVPSRHLTPERRPGGFKLGDVVEWRRT